LGAHEALANRAAGGENAQELRRALQNEVTKSGAFFEAMKAAKKFVAEQTREYDNVAGSLVDEMAQWVEVPRDARRLIATC
jgi:hypothetical protein